MFQTIEFKTPSVVFGMDTVLRIGKEAKRLGGHRVLIVTGPRVKAAGALEKALSGLKAESLKAWWRNGFIISLVNLVIWLGVGGVWWKVIGLW